MRRKLISLIIALVFLSSTVACTNEIEERILYIAVDDAPLRTGPAGRYSERARLTIGDEIIVVDDIINNHGNLWHQLDCGNWIYDGNVTDDLVALFDCTISHSYDARGFCIGCEEEYELEIFPMEEVMYVSEPSAPIRPRPYRAEDEREWLARGTELNIRGFAYNERGNLWFLLEGVPETWIYSGNVNLLDRDLNNNQELKPEGLSLRLTRLGTYE